MGCLLQNQGIALSQSVGDTLLSITLCKGHSMSKFQEVQDFMKYRNYQKLEENLHSDFLRIREEGLITRDEFLSYVIVEMEGEKAIIVLALRCLFENSDSLVWQALIDVPESGNRMLSTVYDAYKDGKLWRSMLNKKEVSKDMRKIP
jgi:hypothetical protein